METRLIFLFCVSIFTSGIVAWLVSLYGLNLNLQDKPNARSSHDQVTPKGGGIGILLSFLIISIALKLPMTFWIPAASLSIVSFIGDSFDISPLSRLLFQFAASSIFLLGIWLNQTPPGISFYMILPLIVYVVGTTTYYNFMDGINGIAGITGFIGFGLFAVFAHMHNLDSNLLALPIALSLCCLGFLPFNVPEAKVFMGDVGSILLGFVFASLVVLFSASFLDFVCLVSFLFPFYADELTTMVVRIKDGSNLVQPHRKHLYQLMANELGFRHWKISVGYGLLQLIIGVSILTIKDFGSVAVFFLITIYFACFTLVSYIVRRKIMTMSADCKKQHAYLS